jgi:hypothetical protein
MLDCSAYGALGFEIYSEELRADNLALPSAPLQRHYCGMPSSAFCRPSRASLKWMGRSSPST